MGEAVAAVRIDSIDAYLGVLRATFSAERAKDRAIVVQMQFTGRVVGDCYFSIEHGALDAARGVHPLPTATVATDFDLWMLVVSYHEDALLAYQDGKFTVEGDVGALLESDAWFVRTAAQG